MPCAYRGGGDTAGALMVQFAPSHSHVSLWVMEGLPFRPPNSTVRAWAASYAMPAKRRGLGWFAGCSCVQTLPSYSHVSFRSLVGPPSAPPNSMTRPRTRSNTRPLPQRAEGAFPGVRWVQFTPSHSQVSANDPVPLQPPNSTVRLC